MRDFMIRAVHLFGDQSIRLIPAYIEEMPFLALQMETIVQKMKGSDAFHTLQYQ